MSNLLTTIGRQPTTFRGTQMDLYAGLLIILPIFELYLLYSANGHIFIYRALQQYYDLFEEERLFIKLGFLKEIKIIAGAAATAYILAVLMDFLTNSVVPNALTSFIVNIAIRFIYPDSFKNQNERRQMKRLEGVIIQGYILIAAFVSSFFVIAFDTQFLEYVPFPAFSYLNLQTADKLAPPKWHTLSRLFVFILPTTVYIAVLFYLANFCFLLWSRAFYYGFLKGYWWCIKEDKCDLEDFVYSDVDSG